MATATSAPAAPLERLRTYGSFVRFEHTLFSLPLILAGVFSAAGPPLTPTRFDPLEHSFAAHRGRYFWA